MAKTYIVNMKEFVGFDEILENSDLKTLYKIVVSEARAAGNNLVNYANAFIRDNNGRPICLVCNYHGQINVAGNQNVSTIRRA